MAKKILGYKRKKLEKRCDDCKKFKPIDEMWSYIPGQEANSNCCKECFDRFQKTLGHN